jgi:hypothetical protein
MWTLFSVIHLIVTVPGLHSAFLERQLEKKCGSSKDCSPSNSGDNIMSAFDWSLVLKLEHFLSETGFIPPEGE